MKDLMFRGSTRMNTYTIDHHLYHAVMKYQADLRVYAVSGVYITLTPSMLHDLYTNAESRVSSTGTYVRVIKFPWAK